MVVTPEFTAAVTRRSVSRPTWRTSCWPARATSTCRPAYACTSWAELAAAGEQGDTLGRRDRRRHVGAVALHVRHDGLAQGGDAPARQHARASARPTARRCWASRPTTLPSRSRSCSSPTGSATPCSSRCRSARPTVLEPRRPTPAVVAERARRAPADAVLRRAHLLRRPAGQPTCPTTRSPPCGLASRPARRCRRRCPAVHRPASASRSSTASARPRRCTSSCPTGPARSGPAPPACPCPATTCRSATTTGAGRADGKPGALFVRGDVDRPPATGAAPTPRGRCSRASGCAPVTPTCAAPRATTPAWAAPATCSRPAASGSRRPRWRAGCSSTRWCARPPWSACPTPTGSTSRSAWWSRRATASPRPSWSPGAARGSPHFKRAAPGGLRRRAAQDRHRQAAALQGAWHGRRRARRAATNHHRRGSHGGQLLMPYVIASACIDVNDKACVEECPVDCIYEGDRKRYINPSECIDCGACEPVCPVEAITQDRRVSRRRRALRRGQRRLLHRAAPRPRRAARGARRRGEDRRPRHRHRVRPGLDLMLDGHLLVDAHVHVPVLGLPGAGLGDWAREFGPPGILERVWRPDGTPDPGRARRAVRGAGRRRGAAVLRVQPEGHRVPALRGPAAAGRARPGAVPAGRQRQPPPALPDRRGADAASSTSVRPR